MFLVLGILIVLFLITLRVVIEPARKITRPGEFDATNIRDEFSNIQKYTEANQTKLVNNINNFSSFMLDRLDQRKIELSTIYVNGYIDKQNSSVITVTVGNYLRDSITNVNVSFGNATGSHGSYLITSLSHQTSNSTNITLPVLAEEKHINVTYTFKSATNNIFFTFTPRSGVTTEATTYELTYAILDKITKDKFVQIDYL